MKRIQSLFAALVLFSFCLTTSCATTQGGAGVVVVDCAKEVSPEILPSVETALASGAYVAELAVLAGKYGNCVIRKAVALVVNESKSDATFAAQDGIARMKVQHGEAWLSANPDKGK